MAEVFFADDKRQWFIVERWQAYDGERRANLVRVAAIGGFYLVQLASFYLWTERDTEDVAFHRAATALAATWTLVALLVSLCLRRRVFPSSLKFLATGADIVLLTSLASLTATKANNALVFVYFLILALAGLRFSLPLIRFATLGCVFAYLVLVGMSDDTWFDSQHVVPPVEQLMVHLSLALCGIVLGQIVRRVRALADDYAKRLAHAGTDV